MSEPSQFDASPEPGLPPQPCVRCGYDLRALPDAEHCPECGAPRGPLLPCVECGYDLRGLTDDGDCPECGTPVARSRAGNLLKDASPDWLRLVVRGHRLVTVGMIGMVVSVIAGLVVNLAAGLTEAILGTGVGAMIGIVTDVLMEVLSWIWLLLMVSGTVLLTMQDPRERLREPWSSPRNVARGGLAATIVIGAVFSICAAEPFGIPSAVSRPTVGLLLAAAVTVATVAVLLQLARLLDRVPDALLAKYARRDARRFGLLLPVGVASAFASNVMSGTAFAATKSGTVIEGLLAILTLVVLLILIGQCAAIAKLMFRIRKVLRGAEGSSVGSALADHVGDSNDERSASADSTTN